MTERDAAAPTWGSNLSPSPKRLPEQPVEARRTGGTAMQTSSDFPFHAMTFRDHAALEVLKAMLGSPGAVEAAETRAGREALAARACAIADALLQARACGLSGSPAPDMKTGRRPSCS